MFNCLGTMKNCEKIFKIYTAQQNFFRHRRVIDKFNFPTLDEKDLKERYIKGTGPGGSKVNAAINSVYLLHKPTGLSVKVQEHRVLHLNQKLARERLLNKLDVLLNKENSVENQKEKIFFEKLKKKKSRQKKLFDIKKKWKANLENILVND